MLAGDRAAEFDADAHDLLEHLLRGRRRGLVGGVEEHRGVHVPVTGMRHQRDLESRGFPQRTQPVAEFGHGRARQAHIVEQLTSPMGARELLIRRLDHPPGSDERRGVGRIVGVRDVEGTAAAGHLGEGLHRRLRIRRGLIDLHDEHRSGLGVEAEVPVVVEHAQGRSVEEFEQAGHAASGHEVGHGLESAALVGEGRDRGEGIGQCRDEAQGRLDDDAQRALGADEEVTHVEPGHALRGRGSQGGERPVGEDDLQRADIVPGHTVFHAAQSARVGGDVAADRRQRHRPRVRWVGQTVRGQVVLEVLVDDAGLDGDQALGLVDGDDVLHLRHVEQDRSRHRVRPARDSRPRALRHDGHTMLGGEPHDLLDVLRRGGSDQGDRALSRTEQSFVARMRVDDIGVRRQGAGAQARSQVCERRRVEDGDAVFACDCLGR